MVVLNGINWYFYKYFLMACTAKRSLGGDIDNNRIPGGRPIRALTTILLWRFENGDIVGQPSLAGLHLAWH